MEFKILVSQIMMIELINLLFTKESQSLILCWIEGQKKLTQACPWGVGATYSSSVQNLFWIWEHTAVRACGPLLSLESVCLYLNQALQSPFCARMPRNGFCG